MRRRSVQLTLVSLVLLAVVLTGAGARAMFRSAGSGSRTEGASIPASTSDSAGGLEPSSTSTEPASPSAFLDDYVDPDGRVVRRDQDGDTVSEGQAYGLLVAVGTGDERRFAAIWTWTESHLLQPSGLLAWHWEHDTVTDPSPATDADLDAAHALLLAAQRFERPEYRTSALAIGQALLSQETVDSPKGPVLVAGPWARSGDPILNPSYVSPIAYAQLGAATADPRWEGLRATGVDQLGQITAAGTQLPTDWARLQPDGGAVASASPQGQPATYGYDAIRVPIRAAGSCDPAARRLAAELAEPTRAALGSTTTAEDDHGLGRAVGGDNPTLLVAAAAAATAAGDAGRGHSYLATAAAAERQNPSYYLSAWLALTQLYLDGTPLGGCAAGVGS